MMRNLLLIFLSFSLLGPLQVSAQSLCQKIWLVKFTDKPDLDWDCSTYLSERTLERRKKHGLPCHDHLDLPLNPAYVNTVGELVNELRYELRWWNGVSVEANEEQIAAVNKLEFVREVELISTEQDVPVLSEQVEAEDSTDILEERLFELVRQQLGLDRLKAEGLDGSNVIIAIFDAGFKGADEHDAFRHLFENNRILMTENFRRKKDNPFVVSDHGTSVLGCIAGIKDGKPLGAATGASFILVKTESLLWETRKEEDHWLAAAEWVEKEGADIISSSLGYSGSRNDYNKMDGHTTVVTRAANLAASRGVLVVNSQGNEGNRKFKMLNAPADGDSVLAVGATYPMVRMAMPFSSYGPNKAGRMKPNVCAPGYVLAPGRKNKWKVVSGTSFSCPLVTGYAACMMQRHPEATNMEIMEMIEKSGHLYPYYDFRHGYGVPDPHRWLDPPDTLDCLMGFARKDDTLYIKFPEVAVEDTTDENASRILYYHQERAPGKLVDYRFVLVRQKTETARIVPVGEKPYTLRIWFEGCIYEEQFR